MDADMEISVGSPDLSKVLLLTWSRSYLFMLTYLDADMEISVGNPDLSKILLLTWSRS